MPSEAKADAPASPEAAYPSRFVEASRLLSEAGRTQTLGYTRLAEMTDRFGHRLSGSKALEDAIEWTMNVMARDGLENARREKVMVPHWVRGREHVKIVAPIQRDLAMLGLGNSVGTKGKPVRGELILVDHVEAVAALGDRAKGKILLINQAMADFDHERNRSGYGEASRMRRDGPTEAANVGAKALLIRSVTTHDLRTPHTGAVQYRGDRKIPAAALSVADAELLRRIAERGERIEVELSMQAKMLPDVPSANVLAELPGRELPDEYVVVGGHIDSWDVGDGASDDGAGCLMAMEAVRLLKELGLRPRRTVRVVLFTNEENGLRGAKAYAEAHGHEKHVALMEADLGAAAPRGFTVQGSPEAVQALADLSGLFADLGASSIHAGNAGADVGVMVEKGILGVGLQPDASHYFDLHHSQADTVEKIRPEDLEKNAAAMALLAFILAER